MAVGMQPYFKGISLDLMPSTMKIDLCDISGTVITGTGYAQQSFTLGARDGNGQRKNTTAIRWPDTSDGSWGSPGYVKLSDVSGNVYFILQISVITGSMPIGDVPEYANIAIGQLVLG